MVILLFFSFLYLPVVILLFFSFLYLQHKKYPALGSFLTACKKTRYLDSEGHYRLVSPMREHRQWKLLSAGEGIPGPSRTKRIKVEVSGPSRTKQINVEVSGPSRTKRINIEGRPGPRRPKQINYKGIGSRAQQNYTSNKIKVDCGRPVFRIRISFGSVSIR